MLAASCAARRAGAQASRLNSGMAVHTTRRSPTAAVFLLRDVVRRALILDHRDAQRAQLGRSYRHAGRPRLGGHRLRRMRGQPLATAGTMSSMALAAAARRAIARR